MRRGYADTAVGQVHYREAGEGEVVVLLHQTASSSIMYYRVMPYLAGRFRVVAMDTPGFGNSDALAGPPGPEGFIAQYAQAQEGTRPRSLPGSWHRCTYAMQIAVDGPMARCTSQRQSWADIRRRLSK